MSDKVRTRSAKELWELDWNGGNETHHMEIVEEEIDNSWRHGNYISVVVKETSPEGVSYWSGSYQESGDGEYNSWRENEIKDFTEVFPKTVVIEKIIYE